MRSEDLIRTLEKGLIKLKAIEDWIWGHFYFVGVVIIVGWVLVIISFFYMMTILFIRLGNYFL
jgi:hypothetical protein